MIISYRKLHVGGLLPVVDGINKGLARYSTYYSLALSTKYKITFKSSSAIYRPTIVKLLTMYNGVSNMTILAIDGYSGSSSDGLRLLKFATNLNIYRKLEGNVWSYIISVGENSSGLMEIISPNEVNNVSISKTTEDTSSWENIIIRYVN